MCSCQDTDCVKPLEVAQYVVRLYIPSGTSWYRYPDQPLKRYEWAQQPQAYTPCQHLNQQPELPGSAYVLPEGTFRPGKLSVPGVQLYRGSHLRQRTIYELPVEKPPPGGLTAGNRAADAHCAPES